MKLNKEQMEQHLKSAVDTLAPNVLDQIDLTVRQEAVAPVPSFRRMALRLQRAAALAAACLCLLGLGGGISFYQNRQVESVIGLDVNPSVELSVNRKQRVLKAEPLNEDAVKILEDLDLKDVELNTAVNAVIGSMVSRGYLDDLDNAILVTVSNDSISKASELRSMVVGDIQQTLQENQVEAVVYDQQVIRDDEVEELAKKYHISYGKAYFLTEIVRATPELDEADIDRLSDMTIEEISSELADVSLANGSVPKLPESIAVTVTSDPLSGESKLAEETVPETSAAFVETESSTASGSSSAAAETSQGTSSAAETESETESIGRKIEIDYIDVEGRSVNVYFATKVHWKNPAVAVVDEDGQKYSARIADTGSGSCEIEVAGIPGGKNCSFTISGVTLGTGGASRTITGDFTMPVVSADATEADGETVTVGEDEEEEETTTTAQSQESAAQTETPGSTEAPSSSGESTEALSTTQAETTRTETPNTETSRTDTEATETARAETEQTERASAETSAAQGQTEEE